MSLWIKSHLMNKTQQQSILDKNTKNKGQRVRIKKSCFKIKKTAR